MMTACRTGEQFAFFEQSHPEAPQGQIVGQGAIDAAVNYDDMFQVSQWSSR